MYIIMCIKNFKIMTWVFVKVIFRFKYVTRGAEGTVTGHPYASG